MLKKELLFFRSQNCMERDRLEIRTILFTLMQITHASMKRYVVLEAWRLIT